MAMSYLGWVVFTIGGFGLLGGGGLMEGFGLVLFLCFTALISSFAYWLGWTLLARSANRPDGPLSSHVGTSEADWTT